MARPKARKAATRKPASRKLAKAPKRAPPPKPKPIHTASVPPRDIRTGYYGGRGVTYLAIDGRAISEGDIVLGTVEEMEAYKQAIEAPRRVGVQYALRAIGPGRRWPDGVMPFRIGDGVNAERIAAARAYFHPMTTIRFVEQTNEPNFIDFVRDDRDCSSRVGMQGGRQEIRLAPDCATGAIAHEICHALGLEHEQKRFDRDTFVRIHWENIHPDDRHNFQMADASQFEQFRAYDYDSIMHYGRWAFVRKDRRSGPTITPLRDGRPDPVRRIGLRARLSRTDIAVLNDMYPARPTGESSDTGPALAALEGRLLVVWKGNGNDSLATMRADLGEEIGRKRNLNERTLQAPALGRFGRRFVLAWTGVGNNRINVMQSDDGASWIHKHTLSETSPSSPAVAGVGAKLFLAWRGMDDRINLRFSADGRVWAPKITLAETTKSGPALCGLGTTLLLAWRGTDNRLNVKRFPLGLPGPQVTLNETADDRPSLCSVGSGYAHLAWRDPGSRQLNLVSSTNGYDWSSRIMRSRQMRGGPAIAAMGDMPFAAWADEALNGNLQVRAIP